MVFVILLLKLKPVPERVCVWDFMSAPNSGSSLPRTHNFTPDNFAALHSTHQEDGFLDSFGIDPIVTHLKAITLSTGSLSRAQEIQEMGGCWMGLPFNTLPCIETLTIEWTVQAHTTYPAAQRLGRVISNDEKHFKSWKNYQHHRWQIVAV